MVPSLSSAHTQATGDQADHRRDGRHKDRLWPVKPVPAKLAAGNRPGPMTDRAAP
jgi:hypothetical protein